MATITHPTPETPATVDPAAVAADLLEVLEQAWNRGDGPGFGSVFADESDFVNIQGLHIQGGAAAIGQGHQGIFDTIYAGSTVRYQLDVARAIVPGVILAVATSTLDAPAGPLVGTHQSRFTMVITEQDGRWVVTSFQNTLVRDGG
jgi:uncharacterized protein (TIGR02246 family)